MRLRLVWREWVAPPPPIGELLVKPVLAEGLLRADTLGQNDTYLRLWLEQPKGSDAVRPARQIHQILEPAAVHRRSITHAQLCIQRLPADS
eukprot:SAG11_NODE_2664_length_3116_cov_4.935366_4_plen_91_part_00